MAKPVNQFKVGQVEIAQWAGTYEDKPTSSFSLKKKKFDAKTKTFVESPFLTVTDLKDIMLGCQHMLDAYYVEKNNATTKPSEEAPF